jgi:hypothetical protein
MKNKILILILLLPTILFTQTTIKKVSMREKNKALQQENLLLKQKIKSLEIKPDINKSSKDNSQGKIKTVKLVNEKLSNPIPIKLYPSGEGAYFWGIPLKIVNDMSPLEEGELVSIDDRNIGYHEITKKENDSKVFGVIAKIIKNKNGKNTHIVAVSGQVLVKVLCPDEKSKIKVGDLLVASQSNGIAMKANDSLRNREGIYIGKAMQPSGISYGKKIWVMLFQH